MKLPYWCSPARFGRDKDGPYVAVDLAKTRDERHDGTTLRFSAKELLDMAPDQRSKHVALEMHKKAIELGYIPEAWALK